LYVSVGGQFGIVDVKSSNDIYDEHHYQTSGYKRLLIDNGREVHFTAILQCGREAGDAYRFEIAKTPAHDEKVFEAAHVLYLAIKARDSAQKNLIPMERKRRSNNSAVLVLGGRGAVGKEAPSVSLPAGASEESVSRQVG
jgi:hypothetical protein